MQIPHGETALSDLLARRRQLILMRKMELNCQKDLTSKLLMRQIQKHPPCCWIGRNKKAILERANPDATFAMMAQNGLWTNEPRVS